MPDYALMSEIHFVPPEIVLGNEMPKVDGIGRDSVIRMDWAGQNATRINRERERER